MVGSERLGRIEAQADTPGFRGPGPAVGAKDMRLVQENSFGFLGMARIPSGRSIGGRRCVDRRPLALRENGSANLLFPLLCLAIRAVAVINDLRLVDCVSVSVRSVKAGLLSFCTRNVFNPPARPADGVMVIVVPVDLVIGDGSRRTNLSQQSRRRQSVDDVVDGLDGNRADLVDDPLPQGLDAGMPALLRCAQKGQTRLRDAQPRIAQRVRIVSHRSCRSLSIVCTVQ